MNYEFEIPQEDQIILDVLNSNIECLQNLAHQKLFNIFSTRFLDSYKLEREIELIEMDAVGYVVGLCDAHVLDVAEAGEWIYQIDRAAVTSSDPSSASETMAFFKEYSMWKSEVELWLDGCFGSDTEVEDEVAVC